MNRPQETSTYDPRQVRDLKKLVGRGEGPTLEFKRKAAYPEKIVRELIAFANAQGGILLVGVSDDGGMPGLKHPEDESHVIRNALKKCSPSIPVTETFIPIGPSRHIIQYEVAESLRKPHYFCDGINKQAYIRVNDQSGSTLQKNSYCLYLQTSCGLHLMKKGTFFHSLSESNRGDKISEKIVF